MRNQIIGGFFVAAVSASVGALALDDITVWTASPLAGLTWSVLAACPSAAGLTVGRSGGTGAVESYLRQGTQTVGPMTRFLAAPNTCASAAPSESEGLQVGLDSVSIVLSSQHRAACDPDSPSAGPECTKDAATGIRYSDGTTPLTCVSSGAAVTISDWSAVLRAIYFGLMPADVAFGQQLSLGDRDCSDPCRVELVNNWSKLFENACAGGDCTELRHAFRRDENSVTTEVFRGFLSLNSGDYAGGSGNDAFPFCNELDVGASGGPISNDVAGACPPITVADTATGAPGLPPRPYFELYQDQDPIRRPALGTGNLALDLRTPPPTAPTEQVASARGDLGLVLPISVPPLSATVTDAERHARIGTVERAGVAVPTQYCTRGFFKLAAAPSIAALVTPGAGSNCTTGGPGYALCPNGDIPKGGCFDNLSHVVIGGTGLCQYPVFDADAAASTTNDQDFRCLNGANNRPAISTAVSDAQKGMSAPIRAACIINNVDGRVYNLHPHNASGGAYVTQPYTYNGPLTPPVPTGGQRQVVGAFYRVHETRTAVAGFSSCAGDRCCAMDDSNDQIGCLAGASPCSLGFAAESALVQEVATLPDAGGAAAPRSVYAASLNGIEKTRVCVQNGSYRLARFLWLNTMIGFRDTPGGVTGDELELVKCYSGTGLVGTTITSLVTAWDIDAIPIGCKSFDETNASSGCFGPAPATNSCANNPSGVASKLAINETCTAASECASDVCTSGKCSF